MIYKSISPANIKVKNNQAFHTQMSIISQKNRYNTSFDILYLFSRQSKRIRIYSIQIFLQKPYYLHVFITPQAIFAPEFPEGCDVKLSAVA